MPALSEVVKDGAKRKAVIDDCVVLIEGEVADKRGLRGKAIKVAYGTVKKVKPGIIPQAMDDLLDPFSEKVDPFWADCQKEGAEPRDYFVRRKQDIANALLSITDERAGKSPNRTLVKAYNGLRPQAVTYIGDAMPRLGDLIKKHAS